MLIITDCNAIKNKWFVYNDTLGVKNSSLFLSFIWSERNKLLASWVAEIGQHGFLLLCIYKMCSPSEFCGIWGTLLHTTFCPGMSATFHPLLLTSYFHKTCRDLLFLILYLSDKYSSDCCPLVNNRETNSACSYKSCFFCCFYLASSNSYCFRFICGMGKEKGLREGNHLLLYKLLSRMPVEAESKRDAYCYIMNVLWEDIGK